MYWFVTNKSRCWSDGVWWSSSFLSFPFKLNAPILLCPVMAMWPASKTSFFHNIMTPLALCGLKHGRYVILLNCWSTVILVLWCCMIVKVWEICSCEASALALSCLRLHCLPYRTTKLNSWLWRWCFLLGMCTSHMHLIKKRMSALAGLAHATGINVNIPAPVTPSVSLPFDIVYTFTKEINSFCDQSSVLVIDILQTIL